jgi:dTDP-glucose 4,6-dehydratase
MKNILVSGGAGFIGSNFVRYLQSSQPNVRIVSLDQLSHAGSLENLNDLPFPDMHVFVQGDICDRELVEYLLRRHQIDTIVNFAVESNRSINGPTQFARTNIMGVSCLLEAARRVWLKEELLSGAPLRFHHISTNEVYSPLKEGEAAISEMTPYDPQSFFSASKAASDYLVKAYFYDYGLPVTISHCSNNYGPYQFPEKYIPMIILNAKNGMPLPVNGDGSQLEDWLYVEDHCRGVELVIEKGQPGGIYNLSGCHSLSNIELVRLICRIMDEEFPDLAIGAHAGLIRFMADQPQPGQGYAINISKIQNELGWQPSQTLESGLRKTIHWIVGNPHWVAAMRQKPVYQDWLKKSHFNLSGKML